MAGPLSVPEPKIHPHRRKADNTPDDNDRVEIGPTALAFAEWRAAGLAIPDLPALRARRLARIIDGLVQRDLAGVLLFDPLNIRYATDTTNMQLWNAHNPFRACLVLADGYMVVWDYGNCPHLTSYNPLVRESRGGASFFYFATGSRTEEKAAEFAGQIDGLLRQRAGGNRRLAVDKIQIAGLRALDAARIEVGDGEELMERARAIKGPEEIAAMRCAIHACEASIAEMRAATSPGMSEVDIWAELHKSNIRRGGEWIETRLLSTGPRTNPWFQECGPRILGNNEILAFDTDLIGCYGICVDISRTWFVGDGRPTGRQRDLHQIAREHITINTDLVRPGVSFHELCFGGHQLPEPYMAQRYGSRFHGCGLCDEWPSVKQPVDWQVRGYDGVLEPGMVLCVEAYVGEVGGPVGIKLEDQVLVTDSGVEILTLCPFEALLGG